MKHTLTTLLALALLVSPVLAQDGTQKTDDGGQSVGTKQVPGGVGLFNVVYTLSNGLNFALTSVKYTLEPHNDYDGTLAKPDEKLIWLTFAIKNSDKENDLVTGGVEFTLVDDNDQNYRPGYGSTMLKSRGNKEFSATLKPGQGLGQDPVKDELSCAIPVPAGAKIVKIILNQGRKNVPDEKVVRYNIAGYPDGAPQNVIAPLPKYAADPTDPTGATAASVARAVPGKFYPDGYFAVRFNELSLTTDAIYEKAPLEEGKQYVVATFTAKNIYSKTITTFELGGQNDEIILRDADGEKYKVTGDPGYGMRKAKSDAVVESTEVEPGEEITYRYIFQIPKSAKPASITYGQGKYGHVYKLTLEDAKATER